MKPILRGTILALCVALLSACQPKVGLMAATGLVGSAASRQGYDAPALSGHVAFPVSSGRQVQATMSNVAVAATVSLIDTAGGTTVASTVTNSGGGFTLVFPASFQPVTGEVYVVEAVKGLNSNTPGNNAARVRTLVMWSNGWSSLSTGTVALDPGTTALAIGQALLGNTAVTPSTLIGTLTLGSPDTYAAGTSNLTSADYNQILALVNDALIANQDPVGTVGYNGSNFVRVNSGLLVTALSPATGSVGASLTISGAGFDPTAADDKVTFAGGAVATATSAATDSLVVAVPAGAVTGPITMTLAGLTVLGPNFGVVPTISAISPASGSAGTSVAIAGSGFSANPGNDLVTFPGMNVGAVVTSSSATQITVTVPSGAISGPISLSILGQSVTTPAFTVPVTVSGFTPAVAHVGDTVTITGSGFGLLPTNVHVTIGGVTASVTSATPTSLTVQVPGGMTTGQIQVSVASQLATSPTALVAVLRSPVGLSASLVAGALLPAPGTLATNWSLASGGVTDVAVAGSGSTYLASGAEVYKVAAGVLSIFAGNGSTAFSGEGGPAAAAGLNAYALAVDASGDVYISDQTNLRIRMVPSASGTYYGIAMTAGDIYTIAGGGSALGDFGLATAAALQSQEKIAVDGSGNLFIADSSHYRVRMVPSASGTHFGIAMTADDIYTIAGNGVGAYAGDGGPATSAEFSLSDGVAVDSSGNLFISGTNDARIRMVPAASGTFYGIAMTANDIYTIAGTGVGGYMDGSLATSARISGPRGLAFDSAGNLLIADSSNNVIRKLTPADAITTLAGNGTGGYLGDGSLATSAELNSPYGVTVDGSGNLFIADNNNARVREVNSAGTISTVAGNGTGWYSGDGGPALNAQMSPNAILTDATDDVVFADGANTIRMIPARTGTYFGVSMPTAQDVYRIAGVAGPGAFAGDGGPATGANLNGPVALAVDPSANLLVADISNARVRIVPSVTGTYFGRAMTAGDIYTLAGGGTSTVDGIAATTALLSSPGGLAVDASGDVFVADSGNNRVLLIPAANGNAYGRSNLTAGFIYVFAGGGPCCFGGDGGPATGASLSWPAKLALDPAGNLLISDQSNNRVRMVPAASGTFYGIAMTAHDIYTIGGNGNSGSYSPPGDGGPATSAALQQIQGLVVDPAGDLLLSEINASSQTNRIRRIDPTGIISLISEFGGSIGLDAFGDLFVGANGASSASGQILQLR